MALKEMKSNEESLAGVEGVYTQLAGLVSSIDIFMRQGCHMRPSNPESHKNESTAFENTTRNNKQHHCHSDTHLSE